LTDASPCYVVSEEDFSNGSVKQTNQNLGLKHKSQLKCCSIVAEFVSNICKQAIVCQPFLHIQIKGHNTVNFGYFWPPTHFGYFSEHIEFTGI